MNLTQDQLHQLAADHHLELPNGATIRITIESDEYTEINDFDCYGTTQWARNNPYNGQPVRPHTFNGCAEKITTDHGSTLWWQPYLPTKADRREWHTNHEYRTQQRYLVRQIIEYGFHTYRAEYCHGTDAYGKLIVIDYAVLGGIEPLSDPDICAIADVVAELNPQYAAA